MTRVQYKSKEEYLEITVTDKLTISDVNTAWKRIETKTSSHVNVLIHVKEFKGMELKAIIADITYFLKHREKVGKVAFVGDGPIYKMAPALMKTLFKTNLSHYETKDLAKAKKWVSFKPQQGKKAA